MRILGNVIWWIFGGLKSAIAYFLGSIVLALTIVGIPAAWQTCKIGMVCLLPFNSEIKKGESSLAPINFICNVIWVFTGGLWAWLIHVAFGILCYLTIIGIPFGKQHFKMARISFTPFGKDVEFNI